MAHSEHVPGEFPEVRDEAPPTPIWIPLLGLGLLALITLFAVYRSATAADEAPTTVDVEAAGEAAPGGEPMPPPAEEPKPDGE